MQKKIVVKIIYQLLKTSRAIGSSPCQLALFFFVAVNIKIDVSYFPKGIFPRKTSQVTISRSGNFPRLQFPKRQLPKGQVSCRLQWGAERCGQDRLGKLPIGEIPWGSCHLGKILWESLKIKAKKLCAPDSNQNFEKFSSQNVYTLEKDEIKKPSGFRGGRVGSWEDGSRGTFKDTEDQQVYCLYERKREPAILLICNLQILSSLPFMHIYKVPLNFTSPFLKINSFSFYLLLTPQFTESIFYSSLFFMSSLFYS